MTGELWEDIVGSNQRAWPPSYDTCIMFACPRCGAQPRTQCTNPVKGGESKIPCMVRIGLGEGWAHPAD
jgi:hypothetical protein